MKEHELIAIKFAEWLNINCKPLLNGIWYYYKRSEVNHTYTSARLWIEFTKTLEI